MIVVLLVLILAVVLWDASDHHYSACVTKADAENPILTRQQAKETSTTGPVDVTGGPAGLADRTAAINACSHWPW